MMIWFVECIFFYLQYVDEFCAFIFTPGIHKVKPFLIQSNTIFVVQDGAIILASDDVLDYPLISPLPQYGQGRDHLGDRHVPFIFAENSSNIHILGGGIIDGQGSIWWRRRISKEETVTRPHLIEFKNCKNCSVSSITLKDSGFWTLHITLSQLILVNKCTFISPLGHDAPNVDGVNPDCSSHVYITQCKFSTSDDCVAIKSGWDNPGLQTGIPSEHICIYKNTFKSLRCAGVCIGSEMSGGVRQVNVIDCQFLNCAQGLHVKSALGRGGVVENINIIKSLFHGVGIALRLNAYYRGHAQKEAGGWSSKELPCYRNITIDRNSKISSFAQPVEINWIDSVQGLNLGVSNMARHCRVDSDLQCPPLPGYPGFFPHRGSNKTLTINQDDVVERATEAPERWKRERVSRGGDFEVVEILFEFLKFRVRMKGDIEKHIVS